VSEPRRIRYRIWRGGIDGMLYPEDGPWRRRYPAMTPEGDDCADEPHGDCVFLLSTGLHDKEGTEIFEGDILINDLRALAVVEWVDSGSTMEDWKTCHVGLCWRFSVASQWEGAEAQNVRVVGNLYETPDLIKQAT
jgi:hypothetical protein